MANEPDESELKRAMLPGLLREFDCVAEGRRARRRAAGVAGMLMVCVAVGLLAIRGRNHPGGTGGYSMRWGGPGQPVSLRVECVATSFDAVNRWAIRSASPGGGAPGRIERIGDDDLLATLASIGRPTGLVRMSGRAWLTRDVADEINPG